MNKPKLKPCPFCGGKDITYGYVSGTIFKAVWCYGCHARTGPFQTERDAIAAWNRRK